jgi:hypothetical protein
VRWPRRRLASRRRTGQSLAEFALVTPVLLMLVVIVADFGRVFAASLSIEAAARNAAEAMSNAYLADPPGPLDQPAPPGTTAYYGPLHSLAVQSVCNEVADLANTAYDPATSTCAGMPLIEVCVHDGQDTNCASEAQGATIPPECGSLATAPTNTNAGANSPRWTEVRVCYKFTPILANLPLLSFSTLWLERTRTFTIPCYFKLGSLECG